MVLIFYIEHVNQIGAKFLQVTENANEYTYLYILLQELMKKSSLKLKLQKTRDFSLPPLLNNKGIYALPPKQFHANIHVYHALFLHPAMA